MPAGSDAFCGVCIEAQYATRIAPARWLPLTGENLAFTPQRYYSEPIGYGRWTRPSIATTRGGSGSISGDVPTVGFGYLINGLHGNTVTPTQVGATTAYTQTHTLDTPGAKSFTFQMQMPPVTSPTLLPHDLIGVRLGGVTLSWTAGGVLSYEMPVVVNDLLTDQTLGTPSLPAYGLFAFSGGSLTIGGVAEGNIVGDGSIEIAYSLRDDAFYLGSDGTMAFPVENAKPTATATWTADFVDNSAITRTLADTTADLVLTFVGPLIEAGHNHTITVTLPDVKFQSPRAVVSGPGLVSQPVTATASSSTGDAPSIVIKTTGTTL